MMRRLLSSLLALVFTAAPVLAADYNWPATGPRWSYDMSGTGAGPFVPYTRGIVGSTVATSQVACGATATLVLSADSTKAVRSIINNSGSTIFLGGSAVTTTTGVPIPSGAGFDASHLTGELYCVTASGTATVGTITY